MCLLELNIKVSVTYPEEVSGNVALRVRPTRPPPVNLVIVLSADDGHAVSLVEQQLIWVLTTVVPQTIDHTPIHDAHFLLHP